MPTNAFCVNHRAFELPRLSAFAQFDEGSQLRRECPAGEKSRSSYILPAPPCASTGKPWLFVEKGVNNSKPCRHAGLFGGDLIAALTQMVPTTQILFGSDSPFVPLRETAQGIMQLGFSAATLRAIGRDNALALLPSVATGGNGAKSGQ